MTNDDFEEDPPYNVLRFVPRRGDGCFTKGQECNLHGWDHQSGHSWKRKRNNFSMGGPKTKKNTAVSMSLAFHEILDSKGTGDVCKMEAVAVGDRRGRVRSDWVKCASPTRRAGKTSLLERGAFWHFEEKASWLPHVWYFS